MNWVDNGRSRRGVDCVGFVLCSAKAVGIPVELHNSITTRTGLAAIIQAAKKYCDEVPTKPLKKGTIVLIRLPHAQDARHIGIYTGHSLLHCGAQFRKVVEHRYSQEWANRVTRAFYLKGELRCRAAQEDH